LPLQLSTTAETFLKGLNLKGAMAKDKDRLPPGWQFDPPADDIYAPNAIREVNVPYILLPDNAMPLIPLSSVVIAYLAARQISAFLRAL
jgi:hypothetical protein